MKHIKTFEENSRPIRTGDIVVCINAEKQHGLKLYNKYRVTKFYYEGTVDVQDLETGHILEFYGLTRFMLELDFDTNKYNL